MPLCATSSWNRCKKFCIPTWKIRKMQSFSSTYMLTSFFNLTKISFKIGNNHIVVIWHFVRESRGWKIQFISIFDLLSFRRKKFYNFRIGSRPDWNSWKRTIVHWGWPLGWPPGRPSGWPVLPWGRFRRGARMCLQSGYFLV